MRMVIKSESGKSREDIYPQEGASGLPFPKISAPEEPLSRSAVLYTACDVVIRRWTRRSNPSSEALSHLAP